MNKKPGLKNKPDRKDPLIKKFDKILRSDESNPFAVLGPHLNISEKKVYITVYLPFAAEAWVKISGSRKKHKMSGLSETGIFHIDFDNKDELFTYKIIYYDNKKIKHEFYDPYSFPAQLSELDIHLLNEGTHQKSFEKLGAKVCTIKKIKGVHFAVWAPKARSVSLAGEFNDWKDGVLPMENVNNSGYWCLFMPGLKEDTMYKFAVKNKHGNVIFKSDPYAFKCELRPGNASVVTTLKKHKWKDSEWMKSRKNCRNIKSSFKTKPLSIYEVHLGSWKKDFDNKNFSNEWGYKNYRQLAHELTDYAKEMNFTHIELMPVAEHPLDISWGYQVVNYFAPTSRYGSPEDFMYFVDHCHRNGIGVILDWVPSHFPTDAHGLATFDGSPAYAYENPLKGFHKEWGTYVFDYGKSEVKNFLISNALFWFEKYHIDGLRVDAVASMLYLDYSRNEGEWIPNIHGGNENLEAIDFLKSLNETVHKKVKGALMIAEESSSWPGVTRAVHLGGLGFDMKWNMGWMHDTLSYFSMDPVFRKFHHGKLTFTIWYAFSENFLLPVSHDEVVHLKRSVIEKMPGNERQKFANLRLMFGFMFSHPGKKLNFMGNEIAQYKEWNSESSLDWDVLQYDFNRKYHIYFRELNRIYKEYQAFHEDDFDSSGFQWLDFSDSDKSVIAFVRFSKDKKEMLLFTFNMTPVIREEYIFGVPRKGFYREILNSNAEEFGGTGEGNLGGIYSSDYPRYEFPFSIKVTLPPLAVNVYRHEEVRAEFGLNAEDIKTNANVQSDPEENISNEIKDSKNDVLTENTIEKFSDSENDFKSSVQSESNEEQNQIGEDSVQEAANEESRSKDIHNTSKLSGEENFPVKEDNVNIEVGKNDDDLKPDEMNEDEMNEKIKEIINKIKKY
ncbi:MAG TPA: 1,4-alpha-glucan branching protein GlgB [Ignavibacteria bacterium]|nr:1,4-alpha-glucan branching enzyme [Bacteroidota bacterium]HRI84210.1 1,4-alpha-glucan branching protein GlgB [Ignavibacteria bacterium]HRJ99227.1 1,4-alpha-glucan branching protein GlgB [Ignavibacteria bacterium]